MNRITIESQSPADTQAIGRKLGDALRIGDVIALNGPLGAGKTHLAKGIAEGAGVADPRQVNSPTFVFCNEYPARIPIYHLDAYRLGSSTELEALGLDEMIQTGAVLIEWAEKVQQAFPENILTIAITPTGEQSRSFTLTPVGDRPEVLASSSIESP
jgi:tRNA threonylcarbamoyladenosine biosynthesis protein TsaE